MVREDFAGRVLPFDSAAARAYGDIAAAPVLGPTDSGGRLSDGRHRPHHRRGRRDFQ